MKIAIISDIHSNKPALDYVYQDSKNQEVEEYWCLGDVVGYGPWPFQCWQFLESVIKPKAWLPGNHELALNRSNSEYCSGDAKVVIDLHRMVFQKAYPIIFKQIATQEKNYVMEPCEGIFLAHGVYEENNIFDSVTSYIDSKYRKQHLVEEAINQIQNKNKTVKAFVVGHTHVPMLWQRNDKKKPDWEKIEFRSNELKNISSDATIFINPGSVGQPRDGHLEASYCILSWNKDEKFIDSVEFRKVPYPVKLIRRAIIEEGYPKGIQKRYTKCQSQKKGAER
jgi:predicted phosphodiesterase